MERYEDPLSPQAVLEQLQMILSSPDFDASERNRAFLRYVIDETLAGRAERIKGYSIAQSVFKRDSDFDPQLDPVVRIEASRLRRSLERYYLKSGRNDPVQIDLPKGGYVPTFEANDIPSTVQAEQTIPAPQSGIHTTLSEANLPSVAIIPFRALDDDPKHEILARGITEELGVALIHFSNVRVLAATALPTPWPLGDAGRTRFILQGGVRTLTHSVRITAQLLSATDGTYVWATSFDRALKADASVEVETEIAGTIAASIGAPYGAIARFLARKSASESADHSAYRAFIRSFVYRRSGAPELREEIRKSLQAAISADPDDGESWAQLAYVRLDDYREGFTEVANRETMLGPALEAAQRAVDLDRHSALAHLALSAVFYHRQELDRAHQEGYRALELNPYNPEVLAQVGWRLAVPGNWDVGMRLFRRSMKLDPDPPNWFRLVLALDAYRRRDERAALHEIRNGALVRIPTAYVVVSAILAEFGQAAEAHETFQAGRTIFPSIFDDPGALLRLYNLDTAVAERLLKSLRGSKLGSC